MAQTCLHTRRSRRHVNCVYECHDDTQHRSEETATGLSMGEPSELQPDPVLFAPLTTDSRAQHIRDAVDAAFDDQLQGLDSSSSLVLAERTRTCPSDTDESCSEWELNIPLDDSAYDLHGSFKEVDWRVMFEHATPRSIGRILERHVEISDGEEYIDDGTIVLHQIRVSENPMLKTAEDARAKSYASANRRSWKRAREDLERLREAGEQQVVIAVMFDSEIRSVSRHSINWFDVEDTGKIGQQIRAEQQSRMKGIHERNQDDLEQLQLCAWGHGSPSINAATVQCSLEDLDQLIESEPKFIAGIYVDEEDRPTDGESFRSESESRLTNYLDVNTTDARTGSEPSPSGSARVTVAYADPEGFYEINQHPAFNYLHCLSGWCNWVSRVYEKKGCNFMTCADDWGQGDPWSHGSKVIGALQTVLDGQDSNITDPTQREERSYGAYGVWLRLYDTGTGTDLARAVENAREPTGTGYSTTDIFGYSSVGGDCEDPRGSNGFLTSQIDNAYDDGLFAVFSAANWVSRYQSECSTSGRATRSDALVVGGLGDITEGTSPTWDYATVPLMWASRTDLTDTNDRCPLIQHPEGSSYCYSSAEGGGDLYSDGNLRPRARTIVDIAGPSGRHYSARRYENGTSGYDATGSGTSHSASTLTAAAVSIRDWGYERSHSFWHNPTVIHTMMLLGGDYTGEYWSGADPMNQDAVRPPQTYYRRRGFSRIWGSGRLQIQRLNSGSQAGGTLQGTWAWRGTSRTLNDMTHEWVRLSSNPTPSSTEEVVSVFSWDEPGLSGESDDPAANIFLGLYSDAPDSDGSCPLEPNSASPVFLGGDDSRDTKRRLALGPQFVVGNSDVIGECIYALLTSPFNDPPEAREGALVMYRHGGTN